MAFVPPQDPTGLAAPSLRSLGDHLSLAPFDAKQFQAGDLRRKMKLAALSWADYGFGAPRIAYAFYLLKHCFWFYAWRFFVGFSGDRIESCAASCATFDAMQRLVLWNLLFEAAGLGCASGPLTGRFLNPFPAIFHWLWPGTLKMPLRLDLRDGREPLLPGAGTRRSIFDVVMFIAFVIVTLRALMSSEIGLHECIPVVVLLMIIGLLDVTIWLAARSEVYLYMVVTFCFCGQTSTAAILTALKLQQLAIWTWAGVSKFGPWFPFVIQTMICNSMIWPLSLASVGVTQRNIHARLRLCEFTSLTHAFLHGKINLL